MSRFQGNSRPHAPSARSSRALAATTSKIFPDTWTREIWSRAATPAISAAPKTASPTCLDVRPAGPALDLTACLVAVLSAEVTRLRGELRGMQRLVDDLLDRESMFAGAACMERLTTAASITRMCAPRARHLVGDVAQTVAGSVEVTA
jgi:hypothetical protein